MNIKRGDSCLAALDQVIRKEISKTRPQITAKKIIASTPASRSCHKGVAGINRNQWPEWVEIRTFTTSPPSNQEKGSCQIIILCPPISIDISK